jgi:hypothetical protein
MQGRFVATIVTVLIDDQNMVRSHDTRLLPAIFPTMPGISRWAIMAPWQSDRVLSWGVCRLPQSTSFRPEAMHSFSPTGDPLRHFAKRCGESPTLATHSA